MLSPKMSVCATFGWNRAEITGAYYEDLISETSSQPGRSVGHVLVYFLSHSSCNMTKGSEVSRQDSWLLRHLPKSHLIALPPFTVIALFF